MRWCFIVCVIDFVFDFIKETCVVISIKAKFIKILFSTSSQIYPLINFTKENHRITMSRMIDDDSSKLEVVNVIRWFFMNSDTNYVTNNTRGIPDGEIGIMDFKGFSWWHLMKVVANIKDVRTFLRYIQVRLLNF